MNTAPLQTFCIGCGRRIVYEPIYQSPVIHPHYCQRCDRVKLKMADAEFGGPPWWLIWLALLLGLLLYALGGYRMAYGANVTLQCNAVTNATGYRFYCGGKSGVYTNSTVAIVPSATFSNLLAGQTYYFAATASNTNGESAYSSEVKASVTADKTLVVWMALEKSANPIGPFVQVTNLLAFSVTNPTGSAFYRSRVSITNQ